MPGRAKQHEEYSDFDSPQKQRINGWISDLVHRAAQRAPGGTVMSLEGPGLRTISAHRHRHASRPPWVVCERSPETFRRQAAKLRRGKVEHYLVDAFEWLETRVEAKRPPEFCVLDLMTSVLKHEQLAILGRWLRAAPTATFTLTLIQRCSTKGLTIEKRVALMEAALGCDGRRFSSPVPYRRSPRSALMYFLVFGSKTQRRNVTEAQPAAFKAQFCHI